LFRITGEEDVALAEYSGRKMGASEGVLLKRKMKKRRRRGKDGPNKERDKKK
jgi:hypothetical protein